jgi:hypothetical protein
MSGSRRRVVWIVGAGSGIGRASAVELARSGWDVALSGRRHDALDETAQRVQDAAASRWSCRWTCVTVPRRSWSTRCCTPGDASTGSFSLRGPNTRGAPGPTSAWRMSRHRADEPRRGRAGAPRSASCPAQQPRPARPRLLLRGLDLPTVRRDRLRRDEDGARDACQVDQLAGGPRRRPRVPPVPRGRRHRVPAHAPRGTGRGGPGGHAGGVRRGRGRELRPEQPDPRQGGRARDLTGVPGASASRCAPGTRRSSLPGPP